MHRARLGSRPSTATRTAAFAAMLATLLAAVVVSGGLASAHGSDATAAVALVLHAAPDGVGQGCSGAEPCSLTTAQAEARAHASTMTGDVVVMLSGGEYSLIQPLTFGAADSGRNGHRVRYTAAPGARPVLSGGRAITGWHLEPGTTGTWAANVPAGFDTRQLYVDGVSAPLSRGLPSISFVQTPTGFITSDATLAGWRHPTNIAAVFTGGNGAWTQTSCPIAAVDGTTITMAEPCWQNLNLGTLGVQQVAWVHGPQGGFGGLSPIKGPTFLENAYELLTPGHWAIDRVTNEVFYQPLPGQDMATAQVIAPALQTLVQVQGTLDAPVHDLTLSGLQFSYGTWTAPDLPDGFPQMQADWYLSGPGAAASQGTCNYSSPPGTCPYASWTRTPANVVVSAAHDVTFEGDTFTHLGGAGIDVMHGSRHVVVRGNEFTDIAASAIQLGSTDDPLPSFVGADDREINTADTISDNYVHAVATQYLGGVGIWIGYTRQSVIAHNQIDDVPYTAISMGWGGWHTHFNSPDADPNVNAGNVIAANLMFNYMTTLGDGGAIYTNGTQARDWPSQLLLDGNVAYGGVNPDFNLYTDTGSQYVTVSHNVVFDQPLDSFATGGCQTVGHIRVTDNYFSQLGPMYPCAPATDIVTTGTTMICTVPGPAAVPTDLLGAAGLEPAYRPLLLREPPRVNLVGPASVPLGGGDVLVSGSGFSPDATVTFGGVPAARVRVLSANELIATAPPGAGGTVPVAVTTAAGTSSASTAAQVSQQLLPAPCLPVVSTGFSTALIS